MNDHSSSGNGKNNFFFYSIAILVFIIAVLTYRHAREETIWSEPHGGRHIPGRDLPVPLTVSPQMQDVIALPLNPLARYVPMSTNGWKELVDKFNAVVITQVIPKLMQIFPAEIENQSIAGVNTYKIKPKIVDEENKGYLLIGLHGGGYMFFGGEAVLPECLAMAHYSQYEVLAIDYRMIPEFPFPAALDDVIAVYQEVIKTHKPEKIAMFGTSAGGGLLLAAVLKMQELNLPLPKVLSVGTPWSDLSKTGDSYFVNDDVDNVVITYDGMLEGIVKLYAGSHDLRDPLISPVYGNFRKDFPPSIFITGTRDLFLSNTVRVFRQLRKIGVDAEIQVFEGMSHAFYVEVFDAPESKEAFQEIVKFVDKHLHHSL